MYKMEKNGIILNSTQPKAIMVGGVTFRSVYDYHLTNEDLEKARSELHETKGRKNISLQKLKDKLIGDKDFNYRLDDSYLLRFLRHRKYDIEKAYNMIRRFYVLRKEEPDLFDLPPNLESLLNCGVVSCLPYRDEDGLLAYFVDTNMWNLNEISLWDLLKVTHAVSDILTMNPSCQISGTASIWDVKGVTARHISQWLYPRNIKIFLKCMEEMYPWRVKRIVAFNCNPIIRFAFNLFRPLVKKKIADRVVLLGSDYNELKQYVNPRLLPKSHGGEIDVSDCSITQLVLDNMAYLKYERSFGASQ